MSAGASNHKGADGHSSEKQTAGSKVVKVVDVAPGLSAVDINKAPPSRRYTRDYGKIAEKGDDDLVGPALGPLRW